MCPKKSPHAAFTNLIVVAPFQSPMNYLNSLCMCPVDFLSQPFWEEWSTPHVLLWVLYFLPGMSALHVSSFSLPPNCNNLVFSREVGENANLHHSQLPMPRQQCFQPRFSSASWREASHHYSAFGPPAFSIAKWPAFLGRGGPKYN